MSIQSKLSITFILLLVFGVTAISSYSIVFIRGYLMMQSEDDMGADARQILLSFQVAANSVEDLEDMLNETGRLSRYDVTLFDRYGNKIATTRQHELADTLLPNASLTSLDNLLTGGRLELITVNEAQFDRIFMYGLVSTSNGEVFFTQISRLKSEIFKPIKTIRWIIYSGMFTSIAIILFVSFIFSQYLARPILQLTEASRKIAEGDTAHKIYLNRNDEFGTLADSLNQMADKLRQENEQLIQANSKLKQFYADITHEIRNPLHTISGTLEMLQLEGISDQDRKKYLQSAMNQSDRLNRLFKDLMMLQRAELDDQFLNLKSFDLSETALRIQDAYEGLLLESEVKLIMEVPKTYVYADKDKIEQVLENLISNAIKYTPKGSVHLRAKERANDILVEVIDTGIGISEEHLPRLFDRFYRTDKARSRDRGGTGLGLAVVKNILDAHESEITVESTLNQGTCFRFSLQKGKR